MDILTVPVWRTDNTLRLSQHEKYILRGQYYRSKDRSFRQFDVKIGKTCLRAKFEHSKTNIEEADIGGKGDPRRQTWESETLKVCMVKPIYRVTEITLEEYRKSNRLLQ